MNGPELLHPEMVAGRRLWLDPAVKDIVDKLHFGDPVLGWPGDPMLALYQTDGGWELLRYENGDYSLVARSKPGVTLDDRLIRGLVARDQHRRDAVNIVEAIEKNNDGIRDAERKQFDEMVAEEIAPRVKRSMEREGLI